MNKLLRNLAIALLIITITILGWLTDPSDTSNCDSQDTDVASVLLGDTSDESGLTTRALGSRAQCQQKSDNAQGEPEKQDPDPE